MMERLFASTMPEDEPDLDDYEEEGDSMKLTSIQSITDFMTCAGRTLPTIYCCGPEEIWQLRVQARYHLRRDAMRREHFPS